MVRDEMKLVLATRWRDRVKGFLAKQPDQCTLLIAPCHSIHTFGMKTPLDVAFVTREGLVLASYRTVLPCHVLRCRKAYGVLERCASAQRWFSEGEEVRLWLYQRECCPEQKRQFS